MLQMTNSVGAVTPLLGLRLFNGCVWPTTRSCQLPAPGSSPPWASCSTTRPPPREPRRTSSLLSRPFLVGERLSLADIAVACTMLSLYTQVLDAEFRKPFVNVTRWFNTVVNQPNAKAVIGQVNLCTKMAEFDAKKFAEFSGKGDNKKEKKEKAPK